MINYERILKECFWEYDFNSEELKQLATSQDKREQSFLFQKILLNSTHIFSDLKIFELDVLVGLIEDYKVPSFNYDFNYKRKNMLEVYFMNKPLQIDELKWV